MALFHQCLNHPYLFGNMAHGGGFRMGRQAIKGGTVPVEQIRPACGEFRQRNASLLRIPDSFVVHIRQIADMRGGHPPSSRTRRKTSCITKVRKLPMWAGPYTVGPQQ